MTTPRQRLLGALVAGVLAFAGCGPRAEPVLLTQAPEETPADEAPDEESAKESPGGSEEPTSTPLAEGEPLPGLYLPPDAIVTAVGPNWMEIVSSLPCERLVEAFDASQWTVEDLFYVDAEWVGLLSMVGLSPSAVLRLGDRYVHAMLGGSPSGCTSRVVDAATGEFALEGAVSLRGPGVSFAFSCTQEEGRAGITAMFDIADDIGGKIDVGFPNEVGTHELGYDDDPALLVIDHLQGLLSDLSTAFAVGLATGSADFDETHLGPLGLQEFEPGADFAGTVTVTELNPLTVEVSLRGLMGEEGGPQAFRGAVVCPAA